MDILAVLEGRGWADRKLLEFARLARLHSLPRAKEYLTYYLNSTTSQTKEPKYFRLRELLQDARGRERSYKRIFCIIGNHGRTLSPSGSRHIRILIGSIRWELILYTTSTSATLLANSTCLVHCGAIRGPATSSRGAKILISGIQATPSVLPSAFMKRRRDWKARRAGRWWRGLRRSRCWLPKW